MMVICGKRDLEVTALSDLRSGDTFTNADSFELDASDIFIVLGEKEPYYAVNLLGKLFHEDHFYMERIFRVDLSIDYKIIR